MSGWRRLLVVVALRRCHNRTPAVASAGVLTFQANRYLTQSGVRFTDFSPFDDAFVSSTPCLLSNKHRGTNYRATGVSPLRGSTRMRFARRIWTAVPRRRG